MQMWRRLLWCLWLMRLLRRLLRRRMRMWWMRLMKRMVWLHRKLQVHAIRSANLCIQVEGILLVHLIGTRCYRCHQLECKRRHIVFRCEVLRKRLLYRCGS